jgi:SAM-dependent methyltransferase
MRIRKTIENLTKKWISGHASAAIGDFFNERAAAKIHRKGLKKLRSMARDRFKKINFGAGNRLLPGFLHLDLASASDARVDLRQALPLPQQVAEIIFSEHFLEHLAYPEETKAFLLQAFRTLKPGGRLYLSVPDAEEPLRDYPDPEGQWIRWCRNEFSHWHPEFCETYLEHIEYHFRQRKPGESYSLFKCHRASFDFETLAKVLNCCGFQEIQKRDFDPELDDASRKVGSLRVSAKKPIAE